MNTNPIWQSLRWMASIVAALALSACGTPMGLTGKTKQLDLSRKSMVLASFELTRSDGRTMPWPQRVQIVDMGSSTGPRMETFSIDTEGMDYGEDSRRYVALLRMQLAPGRYAIGGISGYVSTFPLTANWHIPLGVRFDVPAQSVVYIGRMTAVMRPRKDTEFRAGPVFPLIDQAVLGVTSSTFDVVTSDRAPIDLPLFTQTFPALQAQQIRTGTLTAFDRDALDRAFMGTDSVQTKPATSN